MRFSILIPTWNNLALLKLCLKSIEQNSSFAHQIIVHVNNGSDGTLEWVRNEGITHTHSPQNVGICIAMNQCAALADSDYLVYLNDDMYCCPDWDARLAARLDEIGNRSFMLSGTLIEPRPSGNACVVVSDFGSGPEHFDETALLHSDAVWDEAPRVRWNARLRPSAPGNHRAGCSSRRARPHSRG